MSVCVWEGVTMVAASLSAQSTYRIVVKAGEHLVTESGVKATHREQGEDSGSQTEPCPCHTPHTSEP